MQWERSRTYQENRLYACDSYSFLPRIDIFERRLDTTLRFLGSTMPCFWKPCRRSLSRFPSGCGRKGATEWISMLAIRAHMRAATHLEQPQPLCQILAQLHLLVPLWQLVDADPLVSPLLARLSTFLSHLGRLCFHGEELLLERPK